MTRAATLARFDPGRLRLVLTLFFLALAVPTAILVYQAYSQLKWEAFEQHRRMAEELSARVDSRVTALIEQEETRSVADYQFLVLAGDRTANFLQRSPLSSLPLAGDLPGLIGYFEVDESGRLTTPLLPSAGTDASAYGVGPDEYAARLAAQRAIEVVLTRNRLMRSRASESVPMAASDRPAATNGRSDRPLTRLGALPADSAARSHDTPEAQAVQAGEAASSPASEPAAGASLDELMQASIADAAAGRDAEQPQVRNLGRIEDLRLDPTLEEKSRNVEAQRLPAQSAPDAQTAKRVRRKEQISLPQTVSPAIAAADAEPDAVQSADADDAAVTTWIADTTTGPATRQPVSAAQSASMPGERSVAAGAGGAPPGIATDATARGAAEEAGSSDKDSRQTVPPSSALKVMTFESEVDPFEFSLLDSGHFVLFRQVWRDGKRHIQGALIEQQPFLAGLVESAFRATALSQMSDLVIAFGGDVFTVFRGGTAARYPVASTDLSGALLYRARLPAPLEGLEMVFTLNQLPAGPGSRVVGWVTLILAIVLTGGFYLLYRLGAGQIALARQQQDFVSAVSHELKTPLTSIRMYGEMLRSGWADEDKKRSYYDYIHAESERLSRLIDNVLQLARLTRSDPSFDLQPIPVRELLDTARSKIADPVHRAGFELEMNADDDVAGRTVRVDADCFVQIVINLVDNAIKFSTGAERRLIRIRAAAGRDATVRFTVRDFGPGIPGDQRRKIFRLFYRSENELTRETVGTGIGLALVHQLTTAMDGKIDVRNVAPGAEFSVSLPVADVPA